MPILLALLLAAPVPAADEAMNARQYDQAAQLYRAALQADPQDAQAWYQLGLAHHLLNQFASAEQAYLRAQSLGVKLPNADYNLACVEARLGKKDAAFAALERALQQGLNTPDAVKADDDLVSLHGDARFAEVLSKAEAARHPCRGGKHGELDFWLGEWEVKDPRGNLLGKSSVTSILDGCVVLESWTGARGGQGKSFNLWDKKTAQWRETWVDQLGQQTDWAGGREGPAMVFTTEGPNPQGVPAKQRLSFTPLDGGVRQLFEASTDGGKTWQITFDGRYRRLAGTD